MLKSGFSLVAAAACLIAYAEAAGSNFSAETWSSKSCLATFVFERDGSFGEFNDLGEDHFGEWVIEGGALYLVFEDNSYLKVDVEKDSLIIVYPERAGETRHCIFERAFQSELEAMAADASPFRF